MYPAGFVAEAAGPVENIKIRSGGIGSAVRNGYKFNRRRHPADGMGEMRAVRIQKNTAR